jgi:peptide chain release factor 2
MSYGGRFDIERKQSRLDEIANIESMDGFWDDLEGAQKIQKEKNILLQVVGLFSSIIEAHDDFEILLEFVEEDENQDSIIEAVEAFSNFQAQLLEAEKKVLLSDKLDANNAIISINAGAGGTESCDWAAMLQRMLVRWCEDKSFKVRLLDQQDGDAAGIKSTVFIVEGPFAYGFLKSESGVHRLVRISPFDSGGRRHTSFASIFVDPEIDDEINIDIKTSDLKIDVYRAGGAGGQSVNTTDSAVRITHLPTGTVVTCQNERSQLQNKAQAMTVLKSRLYKLEEDKRKKESDLRESEKLDIGWGAQIRSYVLHPYKLIKDHRTSFESGRPEKILDGGLDGFMDAYLRWSFSAPNKLSE